MQKHVTKCHGFGTEGAGVTMMVQHKAERGPNVPGWDCTLVLDCTREQHDRLQQLIKQDLAKGRAPTRPPLGEGIRLEDMQDWDLGAYMSVLSNMLVDDGTGTMVRACVKGGKEGGLATVESHGEQVGNGPRATIESHGEQMGNCGRANLGRRGPSGPSGPRPDYDGPDPLVSVC
jgi:hypothetical protein